MDNKKRVKKKPEHKTLWYRFFKILYRLISPKHPIGWVKIDWEELPNGYFKLLAEGLDKFGLPDLEMLACTSHPSTLDFCRDMLEVAIDKLYKSKSAGSPVNPNQIIDLRTTKEGVPTLIRLVEKGPMISRLTDVDSGSGDFPRIALSNHIINEAERINNVQSAIHTINLAIDLDTGDFSYEEVHPKEDEFDDALSRSNARAYLALSMALSYIGQKENAIQAFDEFIARVPFVAERMKTENAKNSMHKLLEDYLEKVDPWEVQTRFRNQLDRAT